MLINGQPTETISARDRGLQYGDGLFETIAVVNGVPRLWERHMARLDRGLRRLKFPPQDKERLWTETCSLLSPNAKAVIKLLVTRGQGGRGYRPPTDQQTTRIISLHPWPDIPLDWNREGIELRLCHSRLGRNRALAGLKHLNRLEQVQARQEWDDPGIPEGLMLDEHDHVIEGTQSNLFLVKAGVLLTPDLTHSGVAGVVRELVLEEATELGIQTVVSDLDLAAVTAADALFITNSLWGICPVARFVGHRFEPKQIPAELTRRVHAQCLGSPR